MMGVEMFNKRASNVSQVSAPCEDWVLRTNSMRELFDRNLNNGKQEKAHFRLSLVLLYFKYIDLCF